jgi:uncharacterized protein YkwD
MTFQWYFGIAGTTTAPVAGAVAAGYTTPPLSATSSYWVRVTDATGSVDSATATVKVRSPSVAPPTGEAAPPPVISEHPRDRTIDSGETATLSVVASGAAPLSYQWYVGERGTTSAPLAGATGDRYTTPALTATARYWLRVSNDTGHADSATATITVTPAAEPPPSSGPAPPTGTAPTITSQPQDRSISAGQSVTLTVAASGTGSLTYQWYAGLSGVTSSPVGSAVGTTYTTPALSANAAYWVRVSNAFGSVDSAAAIIAVTPAGSGSSSFEDQVLILVNQRRSAGATCGGTAYSAVGALVMNGSLRAAARAHSEDMATRNYVSHTSLDGRTFDQRMREAGYNGAFPWAENIAAGSSSPESVVIGWMGSPGHCANIMAGTARATGIGYFYRAGSNYGHYWTQNFGGS